MVAVLILMTAGASTHVLEFVGSAFDFVSAICDLSDKIAERQTQEEKGASAYFGQAEMALLGNKDAKDLSFYPLFDDEIKQGEACHFDDECLTQAIVSNLSDCEVNLVEFEFEASNVLEDYIPVINISAAGAGTAEDDGMGADLVNVGWSDANGVVITASCDDPDFINLFGADCVVRTLSNISMAGREHVDLFLSSNMRTMPDREMQFLVTISVEADGWGVLPVEGDPYYLCVDSTGIVPAYGKGGMANSIYGIYVDTSKGKTQFRRPILESVKANESISVPICFFPSKSASMDIRIGFKVRYANGNEEIIEADVRNVSFRVSSVFADERYNAKLLSASELESIMHETPSYASVAVSYPFASLEDCRVRTQYETW